jgi:hypothetical protein
MTKETWKEYKSSGYMVSTEGRVKGKRTGNELKYDRNIHGYRRVTLCIYGKVVRVFVHRLVYKTFVGEIPEDKIIDHVNELKFDNRLENLQLLTQSENIRKNWKYRKSRSEIKIAA